MDAFLQAMSAAGFEVKRGRGGVISFRAEGQERFTRLRPSTLGSGYGQDDIQAVIEGRAASSKGRAGTSHKDNLIMDIQSRMRAGKGVQLKANGGETSILAGKRPVGICAVGEKGDGGRRPLSHAFG